MTKKIVPHSNLRLLSILGLICVLLVSLMVVVACEEEEEAPAVTEYTLTIAVSPSGGGTTSPSAGTHTYDEGDVVTITATAASGYVFDKWSGASTATTATTTVTMTSNTTVTANFEAEVPTVTEYTLTMAVTPTGGGTTSPAAGTHTYDEDTEVTVTATAATGYRFGSWSANVVDGKVTMDADKTVTATFIKTFVLTMVVDPVGGGTTSPTVGTHTYDTGEVVAVTATPAAHYEFVSWSANVVDGEVTMDADETVTATFAQITHDLTMAVDPVGSGTTDPTVAGSPHTYVEGTVVDIEATAETGWYFLNWTGDVADVNSEATTVTMDEAQTCTANFTNVTHTLTMAVTPADSGTTTPAVGDHTYGEGRVVTITATAETGWAFDSWTGDVAVATAASTTVTMDEDQTVTANFVVAGAPTPTLGAEWVYLTTYAEGEPEEDITEWTVTVTGEELYGGVDCYTTSTAFSAPPERMVGTIAIVITAADGWNSKDTVDPLYTEASVEMFGFPLQTAIDWTYTGDHGWTLSDGKAWEGVQYVVLTPPMQTPSTKWYDIVVNGVEEVTVPYGTFDCFRVEYWLTATENIPEFAPYTVVDPPVLEKVEYFSADVCGNVKIENFAGFNFPEIEELLSYTPGP